MQSTPSATTNPSSDRHQTDTAAGVRASLHVQQSADQPEATISETELMSVLSGVEYAYEAAHDLADRGRIYFGQFEGLPRALRILRDLRDQLS